MTRPRSRKQKILDALAGGRRDIYGTVRSGFTDLRGEYRKTCGLVAFVRGAEARFDGRAMNALISKGRVDWIEEPCGGFGSKKSRIRYFLKKETA